MKTTLQILEEAKRSVECGWTQGCWAKNDFGREIGYYTSSATCFCAEGAMFRASGQMYNSIDFYHPLNDALSRFKEAIETEKSIPDWNDFEGRTQDEVVEAFERAIALEKALHPSEQVAS
jgi:hypothetical protein